MFIISLHYAPSKLSCHVLVIRWKIEFLGTKRHWFDFGSNTVCTILNLLKDSLKTLMDAIADGNLEGYCIRITECSKVFFCIYFHCTDIVVIHLSCLDFLTIMIYSFGFLLLYRKYVTCLVSGILCNLFMYFNLIKCWENRRSICCKKI